MAIILLAIHLFSAAFAGYQVPACDRCHPACPVDSSISRVVRVHVFNQSHLNDAGVAVIVDIANRLWSPYGVTIESGTTPDSLVIIVAAGSAADATGVSEAGVLGMTMFSDGHAMPYIHLWLGAAEDLARRLEYPSWPADVPPPAAKEAPLLHVMGVALAHELGHYLLDSAQHSSDGLLRGHLMLPEMEHADPVRLTLTCAQRRAISGEAVGR